MRLFATIVAIGCSLIFTPASAAARYHTYTFLPDESGWLVYDKISHRPVRFLASGDFTNVDANIASYVQRSQIGCFNDFGPDNCWYDSEQILSEHHTFGPRGLSVVFDEDENEDCDPHIGTSYERCEYRTISLLELDFWNRGDTPVTFRVKITVVPEPAMWALMILGFGTAGMTLRRRRLAT